MDQQQSMNQQQLQQSTFYSNIYKQRGIYSEVVNPENAQNFGEDILQGPQNNLVIQVNQKQKNPKVFSLTQRKQQQEAIKRLSSKEIFILHTEIKSVDPKVMEPFEPIPGRVPRKVAIDRKRKEYASYSIEKLLLQLGIDYNNPHKYAHVQWLPLELFDDKIYDDFSPEEWLTRAKKEQSLYHALTAKGLYQIAEDNYEWRPIIIEEYLEDEDIFSGHWVGEDQLVKISRINFVLDAEDPRKFAKRVANAHQQRIYADSLVRYNHYIDNMPTQDLNELDTEQKKRLEAMAKTKKLESMEKTTLLMSVYHDYHRTMNKIIFNTFLEAHPEELDSDDLFPVRLELPPVIEKEVKYYGMVQIDRSKGAYIVRTGEKAFYQEPKDFTEIFKDFCFASLYIKDAVIIALQEIHEKCDEILKMNLFNFTGDDSEEGQQQLQQQPNKIGRLEDFKHIQDSATSQMLYVLKGGWINDLIKIIKTQFQGVGKGWFNMKETNKITYDFGKLKRFLTVVRLVMQDTLLTLTRRCYFQYFDYINSHIPNEVTIKCSNVVENNYIQKVAKLQNSDKRYEILMGEIIDKPLFTIELVKTHSDEEFTYNTPPKNYVSVLLTIFDKTLEQLGQIPDIEPQILSDLYKAMKGEAHIKAPMKPKEKPNDIETLGEGKGKFPDENKWVWDLYEELESILNKAIEPLYDFLKAFDPFLEVLHMKPDDLVRDIEIEDPPPEVEDIRQQIFDVYQKEEELKEKIPDTVHVSFFNVECSSILSYLMDKYHSLAKNLIELIAKRSRLSQQNLFNSFETIKNKIQEKPNDIEKLTEIKDYMQNLPLELEKIKVEINKSLEIYKILESFNYRFSQEDMNRRWQVYGGPKDVLEIMEQRKSQLEKDKVQFSENMKLAQEDFKQSIDNMERTIANFHQHQNVNNHQQIANDVKSVNEQLLKYMEDAKKYNYHETLFEMEQTDYSKIQQMNRDFTPFSNLWLTTSTWLTDQPEWMVCEWEKLNAVSAEKFVDDGSRTLQGVIRFFKERDMGPVLKIAESIKKQIDEFKPKVPLMVALRKNGVKERHWEQISQAVGFEVKPDEGFNFQKVLDMGLLKQVDACVEIGERAAKEYGIEMMLSDMKGIWEKVNFGFVDFKGGRIIKGYDDIQAILDDHIINTQAMQFSPFKKPFEEEIVEWNQQLKLMSDILEEWSKCQGQWMYLQPIFDSPDIAKQLPQETKKFKTVDSTWKHTMQNAWSQKNVKKVCITNEGLFERLQEANKNLEYIQKVLNNYLEKKREKFARFYFLSNDDLLEILSQTKEPTAVQPHLKKVFENIHQVEFDENKKIHAMFSAEKEKVNFVKIVDPVNKNVEDWMSELEEMMKVSVRAALLKAVENYPTPTRTQWVLNHPGQTILNGSQIEWTKEVEEAIKVSAEGLQQFFTQSQASLMDLVDLVRQKLTKMQSVTLNALIVLDVHAKDVVATLVKSRVRDTTSFEWISQLRYYWERDDCYVKCIQTNFPYGYEYLGNTTRLVITPLTDKCYMTLMGALNLMLGGAPAGPAGTGKTESVKDLAKGLAKQCVVFNCSDSMDYLMIGKFFKGLASAGAWCCFDEFNRINIEVLSVIAMQLQQLFSEKAKGTPRIEFEGSDIKLNPTFCVFITMNPGYAGRTELPDNLKALFRAVAMMVPDYGLIGEILLYSFGFQRGRDLARKMVATFKLSSEQLSSQDHYDYGMRAVRSVINAAGLLKAADPDMDEEQLLLRALKDVNVPKFLKDDLPLFANIIKDLFPNIEQQQIDYGKLLPAINEQCLKLNLRPVDNFVGKVIQLFDTIQVRHGLMLVGPTGGGKTSNYNVLLRALTSLQKEGYYKVLADILNPKSITMGQLYGMYNEQTREWADGVLAYLIRQHTRDQSETKHWTIFDGPVDSLWIESMNTVLDDNKKLCLNSGQILQLTPQMTMMFEVEDLAVASPATVSRCGMVYMEPVSMGLRPYYDSWLDGLPESFTARKNFVNTLNKLFDTYVETSINFLRKNMKEVITTPDNNLVQSLERIMNCYFDDYKETEIKKVSSEELDHLQAILEPLFMFAIVWSIGCTTDQDGRPKFNTFLRGTMAETKAQFQFPEEGTIYDYKFSLEDDQFHNWSEMYDNFTVDPKLQYHEIMIPTKDSTRNIYLKKLLLLKRYHVLCPGPTGTGKSNNIYSLLLTQLPDQWQYMALTFSAQTSANQTQDTIDSKIFKRRKGHYGPDLGKKCVVFIDDLNMPKKEFFGAQPPLELIRQYLDHSGWYNRRDLSFWNLEDLIMLSAMGPPGGGRSVITGRLSRHYNVIAYTELNEETIKHIFSSILGSFMKKFNDTIKETTDEIISRTIEVYNSAKMELLPIPSKSHYTFNMRDIWKVIQGICTGSPKYVQLKEDMVKLWYHENLRVFHDRLNTGEDRQFLKDLLASKFEVFGVEKEKILDQERILFCDFWYGREVEPRHYAQVTDLFMLLNKMESFQDDFNADSNFSGGGKKQMKLVMFLDACEHISRISRIIRQPQGNALLLGVGGSGRQSLGKMATFISGYKLFQIELVKNYNMKLWREDVKKVLLIAGKDNKQVTFLFVDTQIINEQMLEDINNVLNSGDITNIYNEQEMDDIKEACKVECQKKGIVPDKMNIYTQYLIRVKKNIHCVIAMSPLGDIFSTRLRMFPSLINCSTIDWFTEWPEEALLGVGKTQLLDYEQELEIEGMVPTLVEMFKNQHKSVESMSGDYLIECRRHNYVTPTSFLELIKLFRKIMSEKKLEFKRKIERLKTGVDKLNSANQAVDEMKIELQRMQPELEQATKQTEETMERLKVDKEEADKTQKQVAKEEVEATKKQQEATAIKEEAEARVADANIHLAECLKEVDKIEAKHLVEIKSFTNPPAAIISVLQAVIILSLDEIKKDVPEAQIIMKTNPGQLKKTEDYWETAKRFLLANPAYLLKMLKGFDKNSIKQQQITKLDNQCFCNEKFTFEEAKKVSMPIGYIFNWVKAMHDYFSVYTETQPLRNRLQEMEQIVREKTQELLEKKAQLQAINERIMALQDEFEQKIAMKDMLIKQMNQCKYKLDIAQRLTDLLSDEKVRWSNDIQLLTEEAKLIPGNSLIASGMISYAGAFIASYRSKLEVLWISQLDELNIIHTEGIKMVQYLGNPVDIQQWNIAKLPKDDTSIENGIIMFKAERWPLCIDPQCQANKFIWNLGREQAEGHGEGGIEKLKVSDPTLMRQIELAIQFGKWILLENVGQDLDPALEPILTKQIQKTGSSYSIQIGEKTIPYNEEKFKFFMTTTIPNPHYSPETSVKITLINFAITNEGLQEQMLAKVVSLENPNLEQKKEEIVRKNAQDKKQLLETEDSILKFLSQSSDIQEFLNENLINKLQTSKKFAAEIQQRVEDSKATEKQIDESRLGYIPVAFRSSLLFFSIIDLSIIDPMYQYSLQWFEQLFEKSVENAEQAPNDLNQRLQNLNDYLTYSLYENICRSLFEKHKLLFSFLLTYKILTGFDQMDQTEWRYLLAGPSGEIQIPANPTNWYPENSWPDLYRQLFGMNKLENFQGILDYFMKNSMEFKSLFDAQEPQSHALPEEWEQKLNTFQKLVLLKAFRADKVIPAIKMWIIEKVGEKFIIPPTFDFSKCFDDSSVTTPLIIVLSAGSDPVADFNKFAEEQGMSKRMDTISLGQGQGPKADKMIRDGTARGGWVLLQNCHLASSWMPELQKICEDLDDTLHKDFRLWLTSMPTSDFPISVLQNGVKMTMEPPSGLRQNLLRTYMNWDDKTLDDCKKPEVFKKLLFGLALFHAIIQDRRKFGPIGWNIAYEFTNEDLMVCKRQLKMLLDEYAEVPYKVIKFLGAEINYGGRVTDDKDERLIKCIIKQYICPEALRDGHKFSESGVYISPAAGIQQDYLEYISKLPQDPSPEAFGMHDNADITNAQNQTRLVLESLLSIQPRTTSGKGKSREVIIEEIAIQIEKKTPPSFDEDEVAQQFPTKYEESMNTVLYQEILRYNKLLVVMKLSLVNVKKALKGQIVMSEDLEQLANGLYDNIVPKMWNDVGFLSLKPLATWTEDLVIKINFFLDWKNKKATPSTFWMPGFFFPQAFITGTLQNYARKHVIAIDKLSFEYKLLDHTTHTDITEKPEDGCYIHGLFLEGSRWDVKKHQLGTSKPKELFSDLPMIHLVPIEGKDEEQEGIYQCPLYKVVSRQGTLSTTGHSTNFVMFIELPTKQPEDFWVRAGVAAFLSLRY